MTMSRRSLLGAGAGTLALTAIGQGPVAAVSRSKYGSLARKLRGQIVLPGDPAYATAKQLALLQFTTNPRAIVYCADSTDVALSLAFAQALGIPFAVRSGGHSFGGYSTSTGLLIDVSRLNGVSLDASGKVRIGAGAQLVDIMATLSATGQSISGGLHPTTAAGGFLQGGGIGLLTRSQGIASDKVTSATVVLADGRTVTASPTSHPDLFWAIRGGGGGNFGVVTEFRVTPTSVNLIGLASMNWAYDKAVDMLDGYANWLVDAPRTIGGGARIILPDAAPGVPTIANITLGSIGTMAELQAEAARLISMIGPPVSQQVDMLPYSAFQMAVFGCSTKTVPQCHLVGTGGDAQLPRIGFGVERTRLFSGPPPKSMWDAALGVFDANRVPGQGHNLEVLAMGGAANDLARNATAFVHRDTLFTADYLVQSATTLDAAPAAAARAWVKAGFDAIDPHSNGETYQNFIDPTLTDWRTAYYGENYAKLVRVKRQYDPYRAFNFPQAIGR